MKNVKNTTIKSLTNQITYNRLLRATRKILMETVFEFNDDYTRNLVGQKLRTLYNKAKEFAINDYRIYIRDFDPAKPHYMEVNIQIQLKSMIHYVHLNVNNVDE